MQKFRMTRNSNRQRSATASIVSRGGQKHPHAIKKIKWPRKGIMTIECFYQKHVALSLRGEQVFEFRGKGVVKDRCAGAAMGRIDSSAATTAKMCENQCSVYCREGTNEKGGVWKEFVCQRECWLFQTNHENVLYTGSVAPCVLLALYPSTP